MFGLWPEGRSSLTKSKDLTTAPKTTTSGDMTREVNITASDDLALLVEYTTGESNGNGHAENPAAEVRESGRKLG